MAEESQVTSTPVDPSSLIIKRKRGRPRKEDGPGSESGSRRRRNTYSCDISTGQVVSGVLDGKFDAGYMLTVRVGDSGTLLRGVVFEPRQSIPISAANDIAPHVSMIRRAELPIPNFELKNHISLKEKDPLTKSAEMASKLDYNSLTETAKVETKMESVVNQSSAAQQSVNQNYSVTSFKDEVSNINPRSATKVTFDSESTILHVSEALHPKSLSGVNEKGQLLTPEEVASDSKPGSTSMLSSAANFNSQADNSDNKFVASTEFANQRATPVAFHAADAGKEETADLENQASEKNNVVFSDASPKILVGTAPVKIEDPAKTQDDVVLSSVLEPNGNPKC